MDSSFILKLWTTTFRFLRCISLTALLRRLMPRVFATYAFAFVDAWVFMHFVCAVLVWYAVPNGQWLSGFAIYGALRIFEAVIYNVNILLVPPRTNEENHIHSVRRSLVLILVNFAEILFWFASYYRICAVEPHFSKESITVLSTPIGSLYFSLVTMATVGYGDISPKSEWSQGLVSVHIVLGLFMTLVAVSRFMGSAPIPRELHDNLIRDVNRKRTRL